MKNDLHKRLLPVLLAAFVSMAAVPTEDARRIEEDTRQTLRPSEAVMDDEAQPQAVAEALPRPEVRRLFLDHGGWISYRAIDFHNSDNDAVLEDTYDYLSSVDARLWLRALYRPRPEDRPDQEHQLYIRIKDAYTELDGVSSIDASDHDGPHLDNAYAILDFDPVHMAAGRRYFAMGRGLVYGDVNDGVQVKFLKPGWNIGLLAARTLPRQDNIDLSVPGALKSSDRLFVGLGVGYSRWQNHQVYGFGLVQRDFSNEDPEEALQQYTYDSEYYGLGAMGYIHPSTRYWTEGIWQTGKSYVFGSNTREDVRAWAFDVGVEHEMSSEKAARASVEYAFGSGDPDRQDVTDTEFGNASGDDTNFMYFGYMPTGYALSPRLSNLHMLRLGFTIVPWPRHPVWKRLAVGTDYYRFWKHRAGGAISDLDATEADRDIGQEIDIFADWSLTRNMLLSIEYGHFFSGKAYSPDANEDERYFSLSVSYVF